MPTVEGPVTGGVRTGEPITASVVDVSEFGYVEEEYFVSGEARALDSDETASYETRVLVHRPTDRSRFNGTLYVNWPNVTSQAEVPVAWVNAYEYAMAEGYAMAIASAQAVGVDDSPLGAANWDPERYGDLHHPGDEFAHDIFSQILVALRGRPRPDPDPMRGLNARTVLAGGISQSAGYLRSYINEVQEHHGLVDGFMPQHSSSAPEERDAIREDLVPVLWINSEDEADLDPRDDGGLFKLWEVPGASHVNNWLGQWYVHMQLRDHGSVAGFGYDPRSSTPPPEWDEEDAGQYGEQGGSGCPRNYYPMRYAHRTGLHHLNQWVRRNQEPPSAPRFDRDDDGEVRRDEYDNALGGLRLPPIEVPVAHYDVESCPPWFGKVDTLDPLTLRELYPTHEAYVEQMQAATDEAVERGWLLPMDAEDLMERARASPIGVWGVAEQ